MSVSPRPLRLGFAGTPEFAVPALDALANTAHRIAAVFTQPDRPAGRGRELRASAVKKRALDKGIPVHQPLTFKTPEAIELLQRLELDALVVVAYGLILPPAALTAARLGCFNIHASLLPRWRGAAPIQRAVLAGDPTTGITLMRMDAGLDTGPMLARRELPIDASETAGHLQERLAQVGAALICETVDALARGAVREDPQPLSGVTYAEKISKAEASIDWQRDAEAIARQVRAFNPWPVAETRLEGAQVRLWDATLASRIATPGVATPGGATPGVVLAAHDEGIDVACGRGVLRILRLQLAGRKPLRAREFLQAEPLVGARFAQQ